jgi:hypothetical protein
MTDTDPARLIKRLGRRIHNQRARLRQMEGFSWGSSHLHTIRNYCKLLDLQRKDRDTIARLTRENEALKAEVERLLDHSRVISRELAEAKAVIGEIAAHVPDKGGADRMIHLACTYLERNPAQ